MRWFVDHYASKIPQERINVLDVGSYDVNGSYRHLFPENRYHYSGLDMENGPNVDIVLSNPYDWGELNTDSFDVVISGQAFEHIEFFWITMSEMTRVLKKDGLLCLIAPNGFSEHRYPVDCYRFFTDGMIALARYVCLTPFHAHTNCAPAISDINWFSENGADSILIAQKPYAGRTQHPDLNTYKCTPVNQDAIRDGLVTYAQKKINDDFVANAQKKITDSLWHKVRRRIARKLSPDM
jgi:SAM-dependent methyltransferase